MKHRALLGIMFVAVLAVAGAPQQSLAWFVTGGPAPDPTISAARAVYLPLALYNAGALPTPSPTATATGTVTRTPTATATPDGPVGIYGRVTSRDSLSKACISC